MYLEDRKLEAGQEREGKLQERSTVEQMSYENVLIKLMGWILGIEKFKWGDGEKRFN